MPTKQIALLTNYVIPCCDADNVKAVIIKHSDGRSFILIDATVLHKWACVPRGITLAASPAESLSSDSTCQIVGVCICLRLQWCSRGVGLL